MFPEKARSKSPFMRSRDDQSEKIQAHRIKLSEIGLTFAFALCGVAGVACTQATGGRRQRGGLGYAIRAAATLIAFMTRHAGVVRRTQ